LHKITVFRILFHWGTTGWESMMTAEDGSDRPSGRSWILVAIAWLLVSVPLLWGIWTTLAKAAVLFQ
jgi:hypothetical protein